MLVTICLIVVITPENVKGSLWPPVSVWSLQNENSQKNQIKKTMHCTFWDMFHCNYGYFLWKVVSIWWQWLIWTWLTNCNNHPTIYQVIVVLVIIAIMESVLSCDYISVAYLTGLHFIMWAVQNVNHHHHHHILFTLGFSF